MKKFKLFSEILVVACAIFLVSAVTMVAHASKQPTAPLVVAIVSFVVIIILGKKVLRNFNYWRLEAQEKRKENLTVFHQKLVERSGRGESEKKFREEQEKEARLKEIYDGVRQAVADFLPNASKLMDEAADNGEREVRIPLSKVNYKEKKRLGLDYLFDFIPEHRLLVQPLLDFCQEHGFKFRIDNLETYRGLGGMGDIKNNYEDHNYYSTAVISWKRKI